MPKDTVESEDCPPPPYMPHVGSGDDDAKVQQQEGCTTSKDNSSTWWRRALRRVLAPSRQALRKQEPNSDTPPTVAPSVDSSHAIPHWSGHNGMTCGRGATSTKRPLPRAPHPSCHLYSLDVMCCPPPSTPVSEGPVSEGATRWQQARLSFTSDNLPEILRGPPIPWRANLEDCCYVDMVDFCYYPYPVPFFTQQPDSGKVKVYYHNDTTRRNGLSVSVGGHIYERTISLALAFKTGESYWRLRLLITSRDGDWLASLSRADAAALVGLDTVIRVVGWIHPERHSVKSSVMFYAKTLHQPWLEAININLESERNGQPSYPPSSLGLVHDNEMRTLVDNMIEKLIR